MGNSDTRIHQIELLLTLDYLLRFTDENHPATQQDICRHANGFGLKYDAKAKKGNDVRRQRIGDCLRFLMEVTTKFSDVVPFVLEVTKSGKYYIEQKYYLSEEQILKILAAVQNDKFTKDEDTDFLIERLLDSLSNIHNRSYYKNELKKLKKGVNKYNFATSRKIRLVNKAFTEGKMLKIRFKIRGFKSPDIYFYDFWYRVYKIKEYRNKLYALLIPIDTKDFIFFKGYIFDTIENLNIPDGSDKEVLCADFDENRDLEKLFREKSKYAKKNYDSLERMIEENKMPISGEAIRTSFYVRKPFLKFVKRSYEEFFSTKFASVSCTSFDINDLKNIDPNDNQADYIIPHPLKEGEDPKYFVVNTYIDPDAFMSWLVSDVHGNGHINISDMVVVVGPKMINKKLYNFYFNHAKKYIKELNLDIGEQITKLTDNS